MNAHSTHTHKHKKQKEQKKLSGKDSRHKGQTINQKKNQSSSLGLVIRKFFVNGLCVSVKEEKQKHSKTNGHAAPTNKVLRKRREKNCAKTKRANRPKADETEYTKKIDDTSATNTIHALYPFECILAALSSAISSATTTTKKLKNENVIPAKDQQRKEEAWRGEVCRRDIVACVPPAIRRVQCQ